MSTSAVEPIVCKVKCTKEFSVVDFLDGRSVSIPVHWFPALQAASQTQRDNWQLLGDGEGIHWPGLDEDLSVAGLISGRH